MPEGLYGSDTKENALRVGVAEYLGAVILVGVGVGVVILTSDALNNVDGSLKSLVPFLTVVSYLIVALTFGSVLTSLVATTGHVSGAHFNPALTIGLAVTKNITWKFALLYVVVQMAGGITACWILKQLFSAMGREDILTATKLGTPEPVDSVNVWWLFGGEAMGSTILVYVIVAVATDKRVDKAVVASAAGRALSAAILIAWFTGAGINPARSFGSMIAANYYPEHAWVYAVAPIVGAVVAAWIYYDFVAEAQEPDSAE